MAIIDLLPKLKGSIPQAIYDQLPGILSFGMDGPKRLSHVLGQCAHESAGFTVFTENLNYSAKGLLATFPKYFNTTTAAQYERKSQAIANHVYANRLGNSDETSGEGYIYRGRGCIQLTGKDNYRVFGKSIGVDLINRPDLVASLYSLASAAFFFRNNSIWTICDKGVDDNTIIAVTKKVNGGTIGLEERKKLTRNFYSLLTS